MNYDSRWTVSGVTAEKEEVGVWWTFFRSPFFIEFLFTKAPMTYALHLALHNI